MYPNIQKTVVRSVSRAIEILEFIIQSDKAPSFTMIQRKTNIPKSSLSNLLKELVRNGYIQYDRNKKGYYLGRRFIKITMTYLLRRENQ